MIKKLSVLSLLAGCCAMLWGADFWQSKPYTEWDAKEVQTIVSNSPWADKMSVETGQRGVIANDQAKGNITGALTAQLTLVWRTALPVKQAFAKINNTPAEAAKASFERTETSSVLQIVGLPGLVRTNIADRDKMIAETSLKIKGKPDLKPTDFQIPGAGPAGGKGGFGGGNVDLLIVFPRSADLNVDDKEFEFVTKIGPMLIRHRFKLKDMVVNGKLEM